MRKLRTVDLTLAAMFAALMAIGANLVSWMPFLQIGGVPLSMGPFFAILAGLLLGSRLGTIAMVVYMLVGAAGVPVFAKFSAGLGIVVGPTGGFILSYIAAAYAAGKIVEMKQSPRFPTFLTASLVGFALIYLIGTNYMFFVSGGALSYGTAWQIMAWFMVKDVAFTIVGAVIAPRLYRALSRGGAASSVQKSA